MKIPLVFNQNGSIMSQRPRACSTADFIKYSRDSLINCFFAPQKNAITFRKLYKMHYILCGAHLKIPTKFAP